MFADLAYHSRKRTCSQEIHSAGLAGAIFAHSKFVWRPTVAATVASLRVGVGAETAESDAASSEAAPERRRQTLDLNALSFENKPQRLSMGPSAAPSVLN